MQKTKTKEEHEKERKREKMKKLIWEDDHLIACIPKIIALNNSGNNNNQKNQQICNEILHTLVNGMQFDQNTTEF